MTAMRNRLLILTTATLLMGGCVASGQAGYSANAEVTTPELVYIDSDVQVIADYDEPIFYSNNYYWRNDGGAWYRSTSHTRGWVRFDAAPAAIVRIQRPAAYIHYRGNASASAHSQPEIRDHRDSPPPMVREERKDMREERKEERKDERKDMKEERKDERRDERRDMKEERKDERKDAKEERKDEKKDRKEEKKDRKDDKKDRR